jgi:hypothetical protein
LRPHRDRSRTAWSAKELIVDLDDDARRLVWSVVEGPA